MLELRRRVCGKGEDGTRAFGSRGEAGPGDRSCELLVLVLVLAWSERRLTGPGRELASSLLCCAPLRGVVSLPAPPSECDGWWLCIAAGSQPVAARSNVFQWWGVSFRCKGNPWMTTTSTGVHQAKHASTRLCIPPVRAAFRPARGRPRLSIHLHQIILCSLHRVHLRCT